MNAEVFIRYRSGRVGIQHYQRTNSFLPEGRKNFGVFLLVDRVVRVIVTEAAPTKLNSGRTESCLFEQRCYCDRIIRVDIEINAEALQELAGGASVHVGSPWRKIERADTSLDSLLSN